MKILRMEQGSSAWVNARLGVATASQFKRILTEKKLARSSQAEAYQHELLAEHFLGEPQDGAANDWMDRGTALEAEAIAWYAWKHDCEPERVGFCLTDDGRAGCSPDALVGEDGGLEIKCFKAPKHIGVLLNGATLEYRLQIQGGLWVTGRKWWDFLCFNPVLPPSCVRVYPDDAVQKALNEHMPRFLDELDFAKERARAAGCVSPQDAHEAELAERAARERATEAALFGPEPEASPVVPRHDDYDENNIPF